VPLRVTACLLCVHRRAVQEKREELAILPLEQFSEWAMMIELRVIKTVGDVEPVCAMFCAEHRQAWETFNVELDRAAARDL